MAEQKNELEKWDILKYTYLFFPVILENRSYIIYLSCESYPQRMLTALPLETLHTSTRWAAGNTAWVLWLRCRERILLLIALLWTWMSCMKATLKGIGFIESIEIDGGAFMQAGIVTYVLAQMGTSTGAYGVRSRTTA